MLDIDQQNWHSDLTRCSKLRTLSEFKSMLQQELYMSFVYNINREFAFSRFILSVHKLAKESGKHINIEPEYRICKYRMNVGENAG